VPLVYKIDNFVRSSLSSSLVLPNIRLPLNLALRILSYNSVHSLVEVVIKGFEVDIIEKIKIAREKNKKVIKVVKVIKKVEVKVLRDNK